MKQWERKWWRILNLKSAHPNPDRPEKHPKQFATKSQRHKDIILFFLRALVSWWQDEKSFAIKYQIPNKSQHAAQAPALRVTEIQNSKHVHDLEEQSSHQFGSLDIGI